jgi:NADH-quinone oxidoreductase subunit I
MFLKEYFLDIFRAIKSLFTGMKLTGYYFSHPKNIITQQYPDNRATLKLADRFKGEVIMPHDENNEHACTGCSSCEIACPNGSIKIISKFEVNDEGKRKKTIDKHIYHLDMCTMCGLCVEACPTSAIEMANTFEHSVFNRNHLTKILNKPGSKIRKGVEE